MRRCSGEVVRWSSEKKCEGDESRRERKREWSQSQLVSIGLIDLTSTQFSLFSFKQLSEEEEVQFLVTPTSSSSSIRHGNGASPPIEQQLLPLSLFLFSLSLLLIKNHSYESVYW